jgi:hypothetical protein
LPRWAIAIRTTRAPRLGFTTGLATDDVVARWAVTGTVAVADGEDVAGAAVGAAVGYDVGAGADVAGAGADVAGAGADVAGAAVGARDVVGAAAGDGAGSVAATGAVWTEMLAIASRVAMAIARRPLLRKPKMLLSARTRRWSAMAMGRRRPARKRESTRHPEREGA